MFSPRLIPKHQTRFDDLDDKMISLYSRGMSTRDIQDRLRDLYGTEISAKTLEEAELALTVFSEKWDEEFPSISKSGLTHWEKMTPFFAYPTEIRKVIYTTNATELLNMSIRKVVKNKRIFPSDDAALKQLYLALKNISRKWTMPVRDF